MSKINGIGLIFVMLMEEKKVWLLITQKIMTFMTKNS